MSETMQLWWIATFGTLIHNSFVAGLQSEGSEFYIPFWFNSPKDGSDSTVLYLSTFERDPVTVNVSLNVQNRSQILTYFREVTVSPSNVSVIPIKQWLPPDLPEAINRVPNPDTDSDYDTRWAWWVVNYIHITTAGNTKITVHVRSSINNALYTYTPFPVDRYTNGKKNNYEYYILQEPTPTDCLGCEESSYRPMVVIITPFRDTNISTKPKLDSYLQLLATKLTGEDDDPDDLRFQSNDVKYRIQQIGTPQVSIFTPSRSTTETYSDMKVNATKPILVFSGRALPNDKRGFLIHQQIPPTTEWGKTFVSFPRISDKSSTPSPKHHYFYLASSALMTKVTYIKYRKNSKYQHELTVTSDHTVAYLYELSFFYYVLQSDRKMWAAQGGQVDDKLTFLAIPSVEHYANRYKFPAAGTETGLKTVQIKLVIPAQYFQLEQIILDGNALNNWNTVMTKKLEFEGNMTYYLREYYIDKNYSTRLNNSNMHQIYHENSSAVFGLVVAGKIRVCTHTKDKATKAHLSDSGKSCRDHLFAFPAGFDGSGAEVGTDELGAKVGSDELGAEMGTDELGVLAETGSDELGALAGAGPDATTAGGDSAKPESDINKISPAIVVAILLGIMAVMITFVFVVRSAIKRRKKRLFAHHRLSMPMFEMREPDAANCEYDIFISFAEEDHSFVEEQLFHPLEERGFHVCWHHRDFLPGYSIIENIKNSIDRSRRVILVFSEHFHKSEYCMFELRYSCDKMLSTHSQMLIPIVLHEDSFPRELDHITYWGFSAEHPEENNLPALAETLGTPIARESREALDQEEEMAFQESNVLYML